MTQTLTAGWLDALTRQPAAALIWQNPPPILDLEDRIASTRNTDPRKPRQHRNARPGPAANTWIARQLRRRTGDWAVIYTGDRDTARELRQTVTLGHRGYSYRGDFEATSRTETDGSNTAHVTVYARHVGPRSPK